jgi:hypothetical protein
VLCRAVCTVCAPCVYRDVFFLCAPLFRRQERIEDGNRTTTTLLDIGSRGHIGDVNMALYDSGHDFLITSGSDYTVRGCGGGHSLACLPSIVSNDLSPVSSICLGSSQHALSQVLLLLHLLLLSLRLHLLFFSPSQALLGLRSTTCHNVAPLVTCTATVRSATVRSATVR